MITGAAAGLIAGLLRVTGYLPKGFSADATGLSGLVTIGVGTVGVALAVDQHNKAGGALAVLAVNVAMLVVGGTVTLAIQRWLKRRHRAAERPAVP